MIPLEPREMHMIKPVMKQTNIRIIKPVVNQKCVSSNKNNRVIKPVRITKRVYHRSRTWPLLFQPPYEQAVGQRSPDIRGTDSRIQHLKMLFSSLEMWYWIVNSELIRERDIFYCCPSGADALHGRDYSSAWRALSVREYPGSLRSQVHGQVEHPGGKAGRFHAMLLSGIVNITIVRNRYYYHT